MFSRLGSWCARRRGTVVLAWAAALILLGAWSGSVGSGFSSEFGLPNVESRAGIEILRAEMGGLGTGFQGTIVFQAPRGVTDPTIEAAINDYLTEIAAPGDVSVTGPFDQTLAPSPAMIAWLAAGTDDPAALQEKFANAGSQISPDGTVAFATVSLPGEVDQAAAVRRGAKWQAAQPEVDGLRIEYGGDLFQHMETPDAEMIGLAFAVVILIVAFGSVLAMGLPIGTALAGIGVGSMLLTLLSNLTSMPEVASIIGVMIGLGVGIDYALFIVTRFREQLAAGHTVEESVAIALDTSGRAVAFAGLTVVISLLGMVLLGITFVTGLALGAVTVVLVTMVGSLTLLPALLGYAGPRVEVTRWRGLLAAGLVAVALLGMGLKIDVLMVGLPLAALVLLAGFAVAPLRREVPRRPEKPLRETLAYRWSRFVQARPWPLTIVAASLLLAMAVPVLSMRLGFSDDSNAPEQSTARQAYDLLTEGFGPGYNGKLLLVTAVPDSVDLSTAAPVLAVGDAIAATEGVASVSPPIPSSFDDPAQSKAVLWTVIPDTAPQDKATADLVGHLRDTVLPAATAETGLDVLVTGAVGVEIDFSTYLAGRMMVFYGSVLILSFVLLMVVFRSLLVPLKAVVMNLLSIGAAYGLIVAIFQWGWGSTVFGINPAPIEPLLPMMLFAIVFGLSMDYEVFLLSRIREEWLRTGDSHNSVADGLASTARVITAAAAIMIVVFGSFLLEEDRIVKLMGFGLAMAVLLDATVIRILLVPATMELLGDRNWWMPRWLDRILPTINVEGSHHDDEPVTDPLDQLTRTPEDTLV